MKPKADALTYEMIIEMMRGASPPRRVGAPTSDADAAEADAKLQYIIANGGVRFQCIGCGGEVVPADMAQCECGGFVCPPCRRVEEEGVCDHERPDYLDADDDEES